MAYFAKLDENNMVIGVYRTCDDDENTYAEWRATFGERYVKTSYNTYGGIHKLGGIPLRKNYAGWGYKYDEERDAFIPPKEFESWVLNEETCLWEAPIPKPEDSPEGVWDWNEEAGEWAIRGTF